MTGRPSKFTPLLGAAIVADVSAGTLFVAQIALRHRVHPDTIRNWVEAGQKPDAPEDLAEFSDAFIAADADAEHNTISRARKGGAAHKSKRKRTVAKTDQFGSTSEEVLEETVTVRGDWRADAWFAERRWPKRWGANKEGQAPARDSLDLPTLQDAAAARPGDLDELLNDPTVELEEALLRNKDQLLKLLGVGS